MSAGRPITAPAGCAGKEQRITISVKPDGKGKVVIECVLDGKRLLRWEGTSSSLGVPPAWRKRAGLRSGAESSDAVTVGLGTTRCPVTWKELRFHSLDESIRYAP